ncbi:MAG TPA: hypothetical protein VGM57_07830 [Pseudolabrys sp.]|jgi:hypothetical protein
MKKALTIGLAGAALAATLSFVATGLKSESPVVSEAKAAESEPESAPVVLAQVLNYERGPRIIVVPQADNRAGDRGSSRASVDRKVTEDDDIAPPPVRTTPRWAPNLESKRAEPKPYIELPRRVETTVKPRQEKQQEKRVVRHIDMSKPKAKAEPEVAIPQPPSPRRSVLSAPPLPAEGPSPVKPTPRFGNSALGAKAEAAKSANLPAETQPEPAYDSPPPAEITADSPPAGYTPPAAAARDDQY